MDLRLNKQDLIYLQSKWSEKVELLENEIKNIESQKVE